MFNSEKYFCYKGFNVADLALNDFSNSLRLDKSFKSRSFYENNLSSFIYINR